MYAVEHVLQLDVQFLNLVVGAVIPLLVGLLTKLNASPGLKAVLNLALSAVAGAVTTAIQADGNIEVKHWVVGILMTWLVSIVSYYGLWQPTGTTTSIQTSTAGFGLGTNGARHTAADPVDPI